MKRSKRQIDEDCIKLLLRVIRWIYRDLKIQQVIFRYKDYKDAELIGKEIMDCIEELEFNK